MAKICSKCGSTEFHNYRNDRGEFVSACKECMPVLNSKEEILKHFVITCNICNRVIDVENDPHHWWDCNGRALLKGEKYEEGK